MLSLKKFGPEILTNISGIMGVHTHIHVQIHVLKCRNQKASLSAKTYILLLPGAAFLTTDI